MRVVMNVRIALLDLYEGVANEGMRCIREIVKHWAQTNHYNVTLDEFDVRLKNQIPDLSYSIEGSPVQGFINKYYFAFFKCVGRLQLYRLSCF